MNLLAYLLSSMLIAFGIGITVVEKRFQWPVRKINVNLRLCVHSIFPRSIRRNLKKLFQCAVCLSFWAALIADIALSVVSGGHYWLWPLSGFAALGLTWFVMELFKVLDKE